MDDLRDCLIVILLLAVLTAYQTVDILKARTYQLTKDASATRFIAGCELWEIVPLTQSPRTLVLACPQYRCDAVGAVAGGVDVVY